LGREKKKGALLERLGENGKKKGPGDTEGKDERQCEWGREKGFTGGGTLPRDKRERKKMGEAWGGRKVGGAIRGKEK